MYKPFLIGCISCLFLAGTAHAQQFTDDFSDGNFTATPVWIGDVAKFLVNGNQVLQLNNSAITDVAYLSTPVALSDSAHWEFDVALGFAPSNSNQVRIYLQSDRQDLTGALNGYFVRIGENGALDGIDLYRQDGTTETRLIDGQDGTVAASPDVRIRVTRDNTGRWELQSDVGQTGTFQPEGTATDTTYRSGSFLGVVARHTSSNATRFFWDNFMAGPLYIDTIAPRILSVSVVDTYHLRVVFSEWVDVGSAATIANYTIDNGIGLPVSADVDAGDSSVVILELALPLANGTNYTLSVAGVSDRAGNGMKPMVIPFLFLEPKAGDVRIHELMADPTPSQGLPEAEYIELWNSTAFPIDLSGWQISDATTTVSLPAVLLEPDSFLLLCPQAQTADFGASIHVVGLPAWPTLNNDEDDITLSFPGGVMDRVTYRADWYQDAAKAAGGFSLERVDTSSRCAGAANWRATLATLGGTPGYRNSWYGVFTDTLPPRIVAATLIAADELLLQYNKPPDALMATDTARYLITPGVGRPRVVLPQGGTGTEFLLQLPAPLSPGNVYTISVKDIIDCRGNVTVLDTIQVVNPDVMEPGDVVINELLFNPRTGGVDYLEVFNRSDKLFTISGLVVEERDEWNSVTTDDAIIEDDRLLPPGAYLAFAADDAVVLQQYATPNPEGVVTVSSFPNWPDEAGGAAIRSAEGIVIDSMRFDESWHFGLLDDVNGVSLERIDPSGSSTDPNNWFSASSTVGYGTPAWRNSQFRQFEVFEGTIQVDPEVVSPDGDGYQDLLTIAYQFDSPGYVANVVIADAGGQTVRLLVRNELLGQVGQLQWDGLTDEGRKALIGIYVIQFEVFHPDGRVKVFRHRCVVAGRL